MAEQPQRISALAAVYQRGVFVDTNPTSDDHPPVEVSFELCQPTIVQVAYWHDTAKLVDDMLQGAFGLGITPFNRIETNTKYAILSGEPMKCWIISNSVAGDDIIASIEQAMASDSSHADSSEAICHTLDLSHSRVQIRIYGPEARSVLNRHLSLDLRDASFPNGASASTVFHHTSVSLLRVDEGTIPHYHLLLPRGFSASLWELLMASAGGFCYQVL